MLQKKLQLVLRFLHFLLVTYSTKMELVQAFHLGENFQICQLPPRQKWEEIILIQL